MENYAGGGRSTVAQVHFPQGKGPKQVLELAQFSIEKAPEEIFWTDREARIVYANHAACRSLGYSMEELLRMHVPDVDPDFAAQRWPQHWQELKTRHSLVFESRHRARDGRIFPVEISANHLAFGGEEYNVAFVRDITERKRAEETLRESEQRYRLLFDSNPQPMWVYDLETRSFLAVNEAAIAHYGYSREEFLAMTIKDIRPVEDIPRLLENLARNPKGIDRAGIWRHRKKDGAIIYVEITSHPVTFAGRHAELVLANDITERKSMEEELKRQQEIVRELSTPVLQVRKGLLIVPLIGSVDPARARQLTEQLLRSIRLNRAKVVVIDITGMATVDTMVANHLIQTAEASRLLGARVILTGMSREIAHTLVTLGVSLEKLQTVGDLQSGIEAASALLPGAAGSGL